MIFEGVNDIGSAANSTAAQEAVGDRLITAFQQIISRIHTFGIPIFAATITPFGAPNATINGYSDPVREQTRQRVNGWIRESGKFDAVVDFDALLRDPDMPDRLDGMFNSGDYLHPNVEGYQVLADQFPVEWFQQFEAGVSSFS